MRITRSTIDIAATCTGALIGGVVERCQWRRLHGSNAQIRAAARRHALRAGHRVSVEECTDTTYTGDAQ